MKIHLLPPAVVFFAQVPTVPPDSFLTWLQSFFYIVGAAVLLVLGTNELIKLYDRVRGKQAPPSGQEHITAEQFERHERRDSERFENLAKQIEGTGKELGKSHNKVERAVVRLMAMLDAKGLIRLNHDDEDSDSK
jgi:hypothetical protein